VIESIGRDVVKGLISSMGRALRGMDSRLRFLLVLAVTSVIASGAFAYVDFGSWAADLLMNTGFIVLGLVVAVHIGERFVEEAARKYWAPVNKALKRRSVRASLYCLGGFISAPSIQMQMQEIGLISPPRYVDIESNLQLARNFSARHLMPSIKRYTSLRPPPRTTADFIGFTSDDWDAIRRGLIQSAEATTQLLAVSGNHQGPAIMEAIFDLDAALQRSLGLYEVRIDEGSGAGEMSYLVALLEALQESAEAAEQLLIRVQEAD
jgi:hypothetical protein